MTANSAQQLDFTGRTILVTGAGGSLGLTASVALASAGAQLILLDKAVTRLEQASDTIVAAGLQMPALYPIDFEKATDADYETLAEIIDEQFGQLHGLLHCAAELGTLQPLADVKAKTWHTALQVNLTAPFLLTRELLPLLTAAGNATVVFTTDSAARGHNAYWGGYGITKNAIENLALSWAAELQNVSNLRFLVFSPGPTSSAIRRKTHPGELFESLPVPETLAASFIRLLHPCCDAPTGSLVGQI